MPPDDRFTRDEFQSILNTYPIGEMMLSDAIVNNGAQARKIVDDALSEVVVAAPANPTRHWLRLS
ncbi:hypothetical protein [Burkholderia thailandensis]|uniref:hypothetical protein n=1 Tax=Burkholderia thailandensis TaxID=57975 RepID=UPI003F8F1626